MSNQGKEFTLPSGAKLYVSSASFADSNALLKAILKEFRGITLKPGEIDTKIGDLFDKPEMFGQFVDKILGVAVSPDVENAVFSCATKATYEDVRISPSLFDDPKLGEKAREDYYTICLRIIEVNCAPFLRATFSGLKTARANGASSRA